MTVLAKAIMLSALERKESRGAHYRTDFPETKEEFRKCSVAEFADGEIRIRFDSE